MAKEISSLHRAGLTIGLVTFLVTNAQANPFQAEVLKTGYENNPPENQDIVTPHTYPGTTAGDVTPGTNSANTPHVEEPPVASDRDPFSDGSVYVVKPEGEDKATDGKCGMSGNGD